MSEIPLQSRPEKPIPGIPGAVIREVESLPEHLEGGIEIGPYTEAKPGALLFEIPKIARYLVQSGNLIELWSYPDADRNAVELFARTSARAALIHQRGELPLNAATLIAPNWKCVAIAGPSAHGKSALAAELSSRGWLLLADGFTRVSWNGTMGVAWPSDSSLKLWRDNCEILGLDVSTLERVRSGLEKFFVPVKAATTPAALAVLVKLRISPFAEIINCPPGDRMALLSDCTVRPHLAIPLGCESLHRRLIGNVAPTCRMLGLGGARKVGVAEMADRLSESLL